MTERARKFAEKLIEAAKLGGKNVESTLWDGDILCDALALKNALVLCLRIRNVGGAYRPYFLEDIGRSRTFMTEWERNKKKRQKKQ